MSPDNLLNLAAFVGFGGMVTVFGWIWKLSGRLTILEASASAAVERAMKAEAEAQRTRDVLSLFQLEANRRFVTDEMMNKVEERVIEAINRLADRLDRIIEGKTQRRSSGN